MTTRTTLWVLGCVFSSFLYGQSAPKTYSIQRTSTPPVIDGVGDDYTWKSANVADGFFMLEPDNGPLEPAGRTTEVKLAYDDDAIYIFARMNDPEPSKILKQLSKRDDFSANTDWIGVFINPFNDGLNDFSFHVTAAGVQADGRVTADGNDASWNTVWESKVVIDESGWTAEIKIPYRCLRFPDDPDRVWGLNIQRYVRRTRELYSWNYIDRSTSTYELQTGQLQGVTNIDPPVRLSFMPYLSAYGNYFPSGDFTSSVNLGMDVKYGINESFTLDATLIPDFGQVAFDEQFLNLGPFENQFQENRQFFVEGTSLFSKGDLLYSRRIGGTPENFSNADLSGLTNQTQNYTRLLNATKVSGRTSKNLGIGVLNAITDNNYIEGTDSVGNPVSILTEPLTNYNVFVLDQRINRNSSFSLVNTNVLRNGDARDANVTGLIADVNNKSNSYNLYADVKYSHIEESDSSFGDVASYVAYKKIKGNWRWLVAERYTGASYDQNDLGFMSRNNQWNHTIQGSYQTFQPSGLFNRYRFTLAASLYTLAQPNLYENFEVYGNYFAMTRNFFAFGGNYSFSPFGKVDFFEPRVRGMKFNVPSSQFVSAWISTDYRKQFAVDVRFEEETWSEYDYEYYKVSVRPIFRLNDQWSFYYQIAPSRRNNSIGWATQQSDSVIFGARDIVTVEQSFGAAFAFSPTLSGSADFRHYWRNVDYNQYYELLSNGDLTAVPTDYGRDINFNTVNLDVKMSWWLLPGSELTVLYRTSLVSNEAVEGGYFKNFSESYSLPSTQIFSIRFTYFFDYSILAK